MASLSVNEACTGCGLCATTCAWRVIELGGTGFPRYRDGGAERCNLCGHCEAICPTGAIEVDEAGGEPGVREAANGGANGLFPPTPALPRKGGGGDQERSGGDGVLIAPDLLAHHLRMRRSIRRYRQDPVDRTTIEQMMEIVRYAPTGRNRQNVQWLIIHDTAELRGLTRVAIDWMRDGASGTPFAARFDVPGMVQAWEEGRDPVCLHAPHLFIAYVRSDDAVARTNAIISLSHLDIAAPAFGLGTCWGGIFMLAVQSCEPLQAALKLPPEHVPVHCLMLGYPALRYQRAPKRNPASIIWR